MSNIDINKQKRKNFKERIWFIKYWAHYIRANPDQEWSKGQKILIDSQIQGAREKFIRCKKK